MGLKKKKIRILGAGISGMVAAITLARKGFEVEIFEKRPRIGSFFERDIHSLRNYFYDYDVIEKYKGLGIEIPYVYPIFKELRFSPSLKKVEIYSEGKPLFYNFIRGYKDKRSLDVVLYKTAKKLGVKFYFNRNLTEDEGDIIATGACSIKNIGYGEYYNVSRSNINANYIFLDNRYSPNEYSCILPFKNETAIILGSTKKETKESLKKKFDRLKNDNPFVKKIIKKAKFKNEIFGFAFYALPRTAIKNNKLYIGEAAGFLDAATGFGTHYAILSGYLAANSIIENEDYNNLWKNAFGEELKAQYLKRMELQKFNNKDYEKSIELIINKYGNKISADSYRNLKLKQ
jgi:flavin-dependent dehydrogenase